MTSSTVAQVAERVKANVERVLVGKTHVIELCLAAILSGGHILVEDVPGIGKTTLARCLADSIDCNFKRIQFTPDLMPSDITGIHFYNQKSGEFEFRPGPIITNVVLADEINRATPRTQSALLEAMGERQVTIDDATIALPAPFLVIATQNPIELEGTFPLPEAQLDRFLLRLRLGYPDESEEEHKRIIAGLKREMQVEGVKTHREAVLRALDAWAAARGVKEGREGVRLNAGHRANWGPQ